MDTMLPAICVKKNTKMSKNNKKKKKPIDVDDGRTIADMSGLYGRSRLSNNGTPHLHSPNDSFKARCNTYFTTMKMMFLPMLATIAIIGVSFLALYLILELAS